MKQLDLEVNQEDFWDDYKSAQKKVKELNSKRKQLSIIEDLSNRFDDLLLLYNEYKENNDKETILLVDEQLTEDLIMLEEFEKETLLAGEFDNSEAVVEIHPGAGGVESHDWAEMLTRMYLRWCESKGYKVEIIDHIQGEEAGIKSITFEVKAEKAYGYLKSEKGVHRLVRISPFDSNKRRHTSFASVNVTPLIDDDIEVDIKDEDLRIDTYRSSGAGGQHVNKTDSAVRITHLPTGITVSSQNQRSQIQNRDTGLKILRSKLYELEILKNKEKMDKIKGEQKNIEWGSQIRSYVFCPYTLVKDLRTNYETSNIGEVMDGDIDAFIDAYLRKGEK